MADNDVTVRVGDSNITFPNDRDALYLRWANGNTAAAQAILIIGTACQTADDLVDERGMADPSGKMLDLVCLLTGALTQNSFYIQHRRTLEPVIMSATLYWDLANKLVSGPEHGTKNDRYYAYAYREIIEQIVGVVALITGGIAHARRSVLESHAYHHVLNVDPFDAFEKELGV